MFVTSISLTDTIATAVDRFLVALFLVGALLILTARRASQNVTFFYVSGSACGMLFILGIVLLYLFHRSQSRISLMTIGITATAVPSLWYAFHSAFMHALHVALADPFAWSTPTYVVITIAALLSFAVFYIKSEAGPKHFFVLEVIMNVIGAFLIIIAVQSVHVALLMLLIILTVSLRFREPDHEPAPVPDVFSTPRGSPAFTFRSPAYHTPAAPPPSSQRTPWSFMRNWRADSTPTTHSPLSKSAIFSGNGINDGTAAVGGSVPMRHYLTEAEYVRQGRVSTITGLRDLKQHMAASPNVVADLVKLRDPRPMIAFLANKRPSTHASTDDDDLDGFSSTTSSEDEIEVAVPPPSKARPPAPFSYLSNVFSATKSNAPQQHANSASSQRTSSPVRPTPVPHRNARIRSSQEEDDGSDRRDITPVKPQRSVPFSYINPKPQAQQVATTTTTTSSSSSSSGAKPSPTIEEIRTCAGPRLLQHLREYGLQGGPLSATTRKFYENRLIDHLKLK